MKKIRHIQFRNKNRPNLHFDLVKLEWILSKKEEPYVTQLHRTEFFIILLNTQGKGCHTIDFVDYPYKKGTVLTIRKDQIHRFFRSSNSKGYLLLFTEEFLVSHFGKDEVLRALHLFNELLISPKVDLGMKEFENVLQLVKNIETEYNENNDEFSGVIIRSVLHVLLIKLFRIKSKNSDKLSKRKYFDDFLQFQQLVEANYSKTRKVLDYAKMMNCTSKTLNNICRTILDKPAKTLINEIVIIQIKRVLINTPLSINEIAYRSGFAESTNMFRYFKKHTNSSPEAFRKANN